jgi:hypothetical protein
VCDGTLYDFSAYAMPSDPVGIYDNDFNFDGCVFDYDGGAIVGVAWDERIPCSFKLALPATTPANSTSRIGNILPRFKPAGIRAFVDNARPAWILGQSTIRDESASDGEGIAVHPAVLRAHGTEMLAPLDAGQ